MTPSTLVITRVDVSSLDRKMRAAWFFVAPPERKVQSRKTNPPTVDGLLQARCLR
jgi:hypothetical protein